MIPTTIHTKISDPPYKNHKKVFNLQFKFETFFFLSNLFKQNSKKVTLPFISNKNYNILFCLAKKKSFFDSSPFFLCPPAKWWPSKHSNMETSIVKRSGASSFFSASQKPFFYFFCRWNPRRVSSRVFFFFCERNEAKRGQNQKKQKLRKKREKRWKIFLSLENLTENVKNNTFGILNETVFNRLFFGLARSIGEK